MAKMQCRSAYIDEWVHENAVRSIIARESSVKESIIIGELIEEDDPDELKREFRERL